MRVCIPSGTDGEVRVRMLVPPELQQTKPEAEPGCDQTQGPRVPSLQREVRTMNICCCR